MKFLLFVLGLLFCLRSTKGTKVSKKGFFVPFWSWHVAATCTISDISEFDAQREEVRKMSKTMGHFRMCFWNKNMFFFFIEGETEALLYRNAVVKPFFLQVKKNEKLKSRKNLFLDAGDVTFCTIWKFYPKSWISRSCIEITFCEKWSYFTKGSVNFRGTFLTEHF